MRALEIAIALAILAVCLNLVPQNLYPEYNSGKGLDTGIFKNGIEYVSNTFNMQTFSDNFGGWVPTGALGALLDLALLSLKMIMIGVIGFGMIVFSTIIVYPALVGILGIPSDLSLLLQVGLVMIYIVGVIQFMSARAFKIMR